VGDVNSHQTDVSLQSGDVNSHQADVNLQTVDVNSHWVMQIDIRVLQDGV